MLHFASGLSITYCLGPYCANIFDPRSWGNGHPDAVNTITLEFTRVILAVGVFAIGVELPKAYMARHWKSLFFLLFPVMTWVCSVYRHHSAYPLTMCPRAGLSLLA